MSTPARDALDLDAVEARLSAAFAEVHRICEQPRGNFRMSIPAREDYDSDLIIANALKDTNQLVARVRELEAENAQLALALLNGDGCP